MARQIIWIYNNLLVMYSNGFNDIQNRWLLVINIHEHSITFDRMPDGEYSGLVRKLVRII